MSKSSKGERHAGKSAKWPNLECPSAAVMACAKVIWERDFAAARGITKISNQLKNNNYSA
jgi:hypothetical protein